LLGENGRDKKVFILHIPMATKLWILPNGHQALDPSKWPPSLEHSNGHQALDPSIGHQALDPPSPPFSFSLKGGLG
jgi:hypothetical protein